MQTDPGKVEAINKVQVSDLMDSDGVTPSQKKIRSFLAMVLYYQHFIKVLLRPGPFSSFSQNKRLEAISTAGGCMGKSALVK